MIGKRFLFVLLILSGMGASPSPAQETLAQYEVQESSDEVMSEVAGRFENIKREGRRFQVIVPTKKRRVFLELLPHARLILPDIREELRPFLEDAAYRAGYHTYEQVVDLMKELARKHPHLVRVEAYGRSSGGRDLYVLKLSDNVSEEEDGEPRLMIDAATHGDELITTEVVLTLLQELVSGYGIDPRLTAMVDQAQLYFIPVVNPDGFATQSRYAEGVDPNRNYPYPNAPGRESISIIRAIRDLAAKYRFEGSLDVHAYGEMIMYPWAYTREEIDDASTRAAFHALTSTMAADNGWEFGPIAQVIYEAPGSSADYYFWKYRTKAVAVELGSRKIPPSADIPRYVNDAREMMWRFIESFLPAPLP